MKQEQTTKDRGTKNTEGHTKTKKVGFAAEPVEEIKEHHLEVDKNRKESNPFQKIPPELAYIEHKSPGPRPIKSAPKKRPISNEKSSMVENSSHIFVKDLSVQTKDTPLNFHYYEIGMQIPANQILVDVNYVSLNSYDVFKISSYSMGLSNTKRVLGYEFSGRVILCGGSIDSTFWPEQKVVGCIRPLEKKGALSSCILMDPNKDVLIPLDKKAQEKIHFLDVELRFENQLKTNFQLDEASIESARKEQEEPSITSKNLPALAKFSLFPTLYCRAKQALKHAQGTFESFKSATVLLHGADTNLGLTIFQLLNSSLYSFIEDLRVIMLVRNRNLLQMRELVAFYNQGDYYDPSRRKRFYVTSFDVPNDDIVLPGEETPFKYKQPENIVFEIVEALLRETRSPVTEKNCENFKFDLIVDIIGSKPVLRQSEINYRLLSNLALHSQEYSVHKISLEKFLNDTVKEPLSSKLLKPKGTGSCFVSCCQYNLPEATYKIDYLLNPSISDYSSSLWTNSWSSSFANTLSRSNYYDETYLNLNKSWVVEGLSLFLRGELKFKIDSYFDWRNNFKKYLPLMKKDDMKIVLLIEQF